MRFAFLALAAVLIAACGGGDRASTPTEAPSSTQGPITEGTVPAAGCPVVQGEQVQGLGTGLTLDGGRFEFERGEAVELTLTLTNCGQRPVTLSYRDAQRYDFVVRTRDGLEVWRWSHDKGFAQALGEETYEPTQTVTYHEVWDQRENADEDGPGAEVEPGRYEVSGLDLGCEEVPEIACAQGPGVTITIGE